MREYLTKSLKCRTCKSAVLSTIELKDVSQDCECIVEQCSMMNAASSKAEVIGGRRKSSRYARILDKGPLVRFVFCQLEGNELMMVSVLISFLVNVL